MTRPLGHKRPDRPLEEAALLALMFLLVGLGAVFLGIVVSGGGDAPAAPEAVAAVSAPSPTAVTSFLEGDNATPVPDPDEPPLAAPAPPKIAGVYIVQSGDTLLGIAYRAGLTLDALLLANLEIADPNVLAVKQTIRIPQGGLFPLPPAPTGGLRSAARPTGGVGYAPVSGSGSYVPAGALSVSAERVVNGKRYPAGTFEYLHALYGVPLPLPFISKSSVKLPPPVPPGTCPLTGLPVASADALNRRPLNVRIDNAPAARPQSGLSSADLIFETLAEGGITRFTAVFLCDAASADIGPIRSARLIDLQLAPMLKAILVHVGASAPVTDMIWSSEVGEADFDPVFRDSPGFGRVSWRPSPHNMYASTGALWPVAAGRGLNGPVDLQGLSFSASPPAGGAPGGVARVPYSGVSSVSYVYSGGQSTKQIGGEPHLDANTGQPIRLSNVVILYAPATYTSILEDGAASRSLHFNVQGSGSAILLRDGQAFEAVWHREGRNILFHFTDAAGNPLPLKPGPTIVNIVPLELHVTVE
ncbi:MAG: DUF3048 domain-containing protein [Chloroflexi bacterium]|nr:DUF3048 domain-containing protein [Chloroflexota bacterium]